MAIIIGTPMKVVGVGLIAEQIGTTVPFATVATGMAFGDPLAFILLGLPEESYSDSILLCLWCGVITALFKRAFIGHRNHVWVS